MRASRLIVLIGVVSSLMILTAAEPASAEDAFGGKDSDSLTAGASTGNGNDPSSTLGGTSTSGGSSQVPVCTAGDGSEGPVNYRSVPASLLTQEQKDKVAAEGGGYSWKFCGEQVAAATTSALLGVGIDGGALYFPAGAPGGPPVDPVALAAQALNRTPLPTPDIGMNPGPGVPQLVNLVTFLWIGNGDWSPRTATATAGSVTSTVTAVPQRAIWDMGNGDSVVCQGPGTAYVPNVPDDQQPDTCRYTYRHPSVGQPDLKFPVSVTVEWDATWTASGAAGGGDLGVIRRTSTTSIEVAELQAINIRPQP
jgi:hypothetical protein